VLGAVEQVRPVLAVHGVDERLHEPEAARCGVAPAGLDRCLDERYCPHHQKRTDGVNGPKASRFEILGAWLGIWTPPRDVVIPPVPWRKVAAGAVLLALAALAFAVFAAPAIDEAKDERSAREQRELDQRAAARRARIVAMQQPRFGRARSSQPRAAVVAHAETAIGRDARERFSPRARTASCDPAPGIDPGAPKVAYDCLSATTDIEGAGEQEGARGELGYPYRAIVDFETARYAFCRINPVPSEKAIPDPRKTIGLPRACLLSR
jgi:hypothetical protein